MSDISYTNLANSARRLVGAALDLQSLDAVLSKIEVDENFIASLSGRRAAADREVAEIAERVNAAKAQAESDIQEAARAAESKLQELAAQEVAARDAITALSQQREGLQKVVDDLQAQVDSLRDRARAIAS